jgi:hypothetical protein
MLEKAHGYCVKALTHPVLFTFSALRRESWRKEVGVRT